MVEYKRLEMLSPDKTKSVQFVLRGSDLAVPYDSSKHSSLAVQYFQSNEKGKVLLPGVYKIQIGDADCNLAHTIAIHGDATIVV